MFTINKLFDSEVIDHAAEELKKYLRMMMPDAGDVIIRYDPKATDGFRLGLLENFGLPFEGEDPRLDDEIYIEAASKGGILAGSNPRSVLFAVYRFLRENGCRWLYPGIDGDYVPLKDIGPVYYHKLATHRFRGFCNEGSESQTTMLECCDYYAKLEMNVYMLEHLIPISYYNRYYNHIGNEKNRAPETVPHSQILQWKRQHEAEIAKRGLMFHDIGHGWTCEPFGLPSSDGKNRIKGMTIPQETLDILALVNGKRQLRSANPNLTNVCMSNPEVRSKMVQFVANYAEKHQNVDYLHVWLADGSHCHCECDNCRKLSPSDWYMVIMNELDEELTRRALDTRIVFIAYVDTLWGPQEIRLKNPERFSLLYAPISRSYQSSVREDSVIPEAAPFELNKWVAPKNAEEALGVLNTWKKTWKGPIFCYEYHFWRHQYADLGGIELAKRLHEDVRSLKYMGVDGIVQDGSQRSGFPNAFPAYVYAAALFDRDVSFEELMEDYYSHVYGKNWREVAEVLEKMGKAFDFAYMDGRCSIDENVSRFYKPDHVKDLEKVAEIAREERNLAAKATGELPRPQSVSFRLLAFHADFCEELAKVVKEKALGHNYKAEAMFFAFMEKMGKREAEFQRYYDHGLIYYSYNMTFKRPKKIMIEDQLANG
ncbi:MAG: DUF4838 domain-containing protein [Ruminococcaceae bacterium]|nr:DUF4838 domain-containing protein [Oscillospiraceae bacterium]